MTLVVNPSERISLTGMHSPMLSTVLQEPDGHCTCMAADITERAEVTAAPQPLPRPTTLLVKREVPQVHGGGHETRIPSHVMKVPSPGLQSIVPELQLIVEPPGQLCCRLHSEDSTCPVGGVGSELAHAVSAAITSTGKQRRDFELFM
ncbi:MAG TPA: hypothetical protein VGD37_41795 [Kofleriaceae bacterium]|jgi:hypothetical protein